MLDIVVSPLKKLYLEGNLTSSDYADLCAEFCRGSGYGLLFLDVATGAITEEESFAYWKDFCRLYLSLFSAMEDLDKGDVASIPVIILPPDDLSRLLFTVPAMKGAEYVDAECLMELWRQIGAALQAEIQVFGDIVSFFSTRHSDWSLLGRVCFHLAENKNSLETPFAFLATYAHQVRGGRSKHLPLKRALEEYSQGQQKNMLLRLLAPIHKASQDSAFLKAYVDSGDIYHPLAWTSADAHQFLKDTPLFKKAGIVVKIPNWWKVKSSPKIKMSIGEGAPVSMGFSALVDFDMSIMLGDESLNEKDIRELLARAENLVFFKGQWVEVDKEKLQDLLSKWEEIKQMNDGITLSEGLRWASGMGESSIEVTKGAWLEKTLECIKNPKTRGDIAEILSGHLHAKLRDYQSQGVAWLEYLNQLSLGAILADDMGLGKTIQVIALLLLKKQKGTQQPSLLIVPASLIGNWKAEITRFAPSLQYFIAHSSEDGIAAPNSFDFNLLITTYGSITRLEWIAARNWDIIILDEAQAIKNPLAKQTKAIKALDGAHKLALTGTPVENRLSDLWSLFDFISPGLLGSIKSFELFIKKKNAYAALRSLVSPYILRRMKTDKKIINDLPDKTELKSYCQLSKAQVILYQQAVEALERDITGAEGIERSGIIFSYLIRFKQICNHPSQWLKDGSFALNESGKLMRLKEICDIVAEKQEKILIFTQFKEMTEPLAEVLSNIFGQSGLVLHGSTSIKQRTAMVELFQSDRGPPFFVLSLKAGGSGLNLTAASHVIHFDRWWNPAVENQATDRAFRIGQKRNVLIHKFICKGTLEERIDELIESKLQMSKEVLELSGGAMLTELSNSDLLKVVSLDINACSEV